MQVLEDGMAQKIVSVDTGSPALRAGIRAGDELLRIGGETIVDLLDYECIMNRIKQVLKIIKRNTIQIPLVLLGICCSDAEP